MSTMKGVKFATIMKEMSKQLEALGPEKIKAENEKLRPVLDWVFSRKKNKRCAIGYRKRLFSTMK